MLMADREHCPSYKNNPDDSATLSPLLALFLGQPLHGLTSNKATSRVQC